MKIAVNKCYGGFDMSEALFEKLIEKGVPHFTNWGDIPKGNAPYVMEEGNDIFRFSSNLGDYEHRTNPILISAIEEVGIENASGSLGNIKIIEIPDGIDWEIDDYDGIETVREKHRSW
jgi:hypothetical protein